MTTPLQAARRAIKKHQMDNIVTPAKLIAASNQLNQSLSATLNTIAFLKSGGAGYSPFPQTAKILTGEYS